MKKLNRDGITAEYHQIIEEQKSQGVVELAPELQYQLVENSICLTSQ